MVQTMDIIVLSHWAFVAISDAS